MAESSRSKPRPTPATDRRKAPRRKKLVKVLLSLSPEAAFPAWLVDRSMVGVSLSVGQMLAPGTLLRIRAARNEEQWVRTQVKSCRREGGEWIVGCRFVGTPSYAVLLQFG